MKLCDPYHSRVTSGLPPPLDLQKARASAARGDSRSALAHYLQASTVPALLLDAAREGSRVAIRHGAMDVALQLLSKALVSHPAVAELHALVSVHQHAAGNLRAAAGAAEQSLSLEPSQPMAAAVIADIALSRGMPAHAIRVTEGALARHPRVAALWRDRGRALLDRGETKAATAALREAFALDPRDAATRSGLCLASLYDATLDASAVQELHLAVSRAMPAVDDVHIAPAARSTGTPLRIGVLSADLRTHPVGVFSGAWLAHGDPARIEWYVYDNHAPALSTQPDLVIERLRARVRHWRVVASLSDTECRAAMRADGLDAVLDLSGHTAGNRLDVLAARVAPLQIAYLGYPAPSAAPGIDAMIADGVVMPAGADSGWPEGVLRLPQAFLCYEPYPRTPDVSLRDEAAPFTFGSFNNLAKLDEATVALWCRILEALPDSRLLLCATTLGETATAAFTRARFVQRGIAASRVGCAPPVASPAQLLARYAEIDVALDPLRFNGGTTTLDALWQGVPVITLPGPIMPSRMAASVLTTAGLAEWIARDGDDYVAIATRACESRAALAALRSSLRDRLRATSLIDGARFAWTLTELLERACAASTR